MNLRKRVYEYSMSSYSCRFSISLRLFSNKMLKFQKVFREVKFLLYLFYMVLASLLFGSQKLWPIKYLLLEICWHFHCESIFISINGLLKSSCS